MNAKELFSPWIIAGTVLVVLGLFGGLFLFLGGIPAPVGNSAEGAALTVIPAPTATPTPLVAAESPTPTPSAGESIQKGAYVQISGTGGAGLRLRNQPSLSAEINYLGLEDEVFMIIDGPSLMDGFTWWHLESPTDQARNGWAVSDYLQAATDQ